MTFLDYVLADFQKFPKAFAILYGSIAAFGLLIGLLL